MASIRPLSESDSITELTALLHRAYARLGAMGLNYTAVDQPPEVTTKRIRGGTCFVAVDGNDLAGTVVVQPPRRDNHCEYFRREGVAGAHQLAVAPEHQGRGIGRMLMKHAEETARQAGFTELAVDTAEQATHLVRMYERLGYRPVGWVQWPDKVYRSVVLSKSLRVTPLQ